VGVDDRIAGSTTVLVPPLRGLAGGRLRLYLVNASDLRRSPWQESRHFLDEGASVQLDETSRLCLIDTAGSIDDDLFDAEAIPGVSRARLTHGSITNGGLAALSKWADLRALSLGRGVEVRCPHTGKLVSHWPAIGELGQIRELRFEHPICDATLEMVLNLVQLERLHISFQDGQPAVDAERFLTLSSLRHLDIEMPAGTDAWLQGISRHPSLESLSIRSFDVSTSDSGLSALVSLKSLTRLGVEGHSHSLVTDSSLRLLGTTLELRSIVLRGTLGVTDKGVAALGSGSLEEVQLEHIPLATDKSIKQLLSANPIRRLRLIGLPLITGEFLEAVRDSRYINQLELKLCRSFEPARFEVLRSMDHAILVRIAGLPFLSESVLDEVAHSNPNIMIWGK
jgi:hypothetical protein